MKFFNLLLVFSIILSGCNTGELINEEVAAPEAEQSLLTMGDGKYSSSPKVGYIYSCDTAFRGGAAFKDGEWIKGDVWDPAKKPTVSGDIPWPNATYTITSDGTNRKISGNGLPIVHNTGLYPISETDDAYNYDRNPNSIETQTLSITVPSYPELASTPGCTAGMVAIMISGIPVYNGFDAAGRDAVAHEIQDLCGGHPQKDGQYHYHNFSPCLSKHDLAGVHSELFGYALDGFGLYGLYGEDGEKLTNEDLDECHGHIHEIDWEGEASEMYHYHATEEFPYTVSCFRGEM